jgi:DNA repair protein RecO (recombination protein O)
MYWKDEGYLLSKNNFDENSIIIESFTLEHGKCSGIVYGGNSRKNKKIFQIGNKILINYKSKNENNIGYFVIELIKPVSPMFFDDKKRSICILTACSILKILLPERQLNKKIYNSFENLLNNFNSDHWIRLYILWELSLVKELGFEINLPDKKSSSYTINYTVDINNRVFKIPKLLLKHKIKNISKNEIIEALIFNKNLLLQNFILPNRIKLPLSRNILEKYFC